ncbi:MAG TPA: HNH endonuclease domain-containing protein, partial [Chthonomonadales bacterium]|nr:HNH endonuclease domain-containing protein [Chthonomonadales bacterium]
MERVLGLDLGTNSVGWALVERDDDATATPFLKAGVYVFPEAGELDGGLFVSNRLKRGQKRRQRIQVRRKRQRMQRVTALLVAHGLLPADPAQRNALLSADWDPETGTRSHHPFFLRRRGLDEALTLHEFGRCLHHIARRRGYFSTRDLMRRGLEDRLGLARATEADLRPDDTEGAVAVEDAKASKETSQLLGRLREVREQILAGTARTIGEFCAQKLEDTQNARGVRASGGRKAPRSPKPDPLGWRADRLLHEEEFARLWEAQAAHHPRALTSALRRALWDAIFHQRPLMSKRGLVGRCEFLPARKRMPRAALLAQRCIILQRLVNLRVRETRASAPRPLTGAEVSALADALEVKDQLGWRDVRAIAGLPNSALFTDEAPEDGAQKRPRGKAKRTTPALRGNQTAKAMRSALGDAWDALAPERQNELVERRLHCRYVQDIVRGLRRDFRFTDEQIEAVAHAALPDGYTMHCARVWRDLEPRLRAGMSYWQACVDAGFRREGESTVAPPEKVLQRLGGLPDLRSPVVQRAAKMAFRVINAVIDKYGKPDRIRIEMPRDVSKTNKQREEEWRRQDQNNRAREKARKRLEQHGLLGDDKSAETRIKKVRLWEEADCRSPYEPDVQVTLSQLIHEYEIDHIVPRSRCWDNSWMNLTICPRGINLQKGNHTPHEWANAMQWARIREFVVGLDMRMPSAKKERILREEWTQEEFTNRALSDTRYLSTVIKREVAKLGVPVEVSRGQLTAELRSLWKLGGCLPASPVEREHVEKWRRSGARRGPKPRFDHRHHALDAVLAALTDASTLQRMTRWY